MARKVLIIDDENEIAELLQKPLNEKGYVVVSVFDSREAMATVEKEQPDVILTDLNMPHVSGFDILEQVIEKYSLSIPVFLMSGFVRLHLSEIYRRGAMGLFIKPFDFDEIYSAFKSVFESIPSEREASIMISKSISREIPKDLVFGDDSPVKLGRMGLFVECEVRQPSAGEYIEIELIDCESKNTYFAATGRVIWTRPNKNEDGCAGFGLYFTAIADKYRAFIALEIKNRAPQSVLPAC